MPAPARRLALTAAFVSLLIALRLFVSDQQSFGALDIERYNIAYGTDIPTTTPPFFTTWSRGDGQAFVAIGRDLNVDEAASELGLPAFRMTRVGFSLAGRVFALGQADWVHVGIGIASLTAYAGLVFVSTGLVERGLGYRALLIPLLPAPVLATLFDTAEGLGTLLVLAAITTRRTGTIILSSGMLGITRPSFATALPAGRSSAGAVGWAAGTALVAALVTTQILGLEYTGSSGNLALPITGFLEAFDQLDRARMIAMVSVFVLSVSALALAWDRRLRSRFRLAALASGLFGLSLGSPVFMSDPYSPFRVSGALALLLVVMPLYRNERS